MIDPDLIIQNAHDTACRLFSDSEPTQRERYEVEKLQEAVRMLCMRLNAQESPSAQVFVIPQRDSWYTPA